VIRSAVISVVGFYPDERELKDVDHKIIHRLKKEKASKLEALGTRGRFELPSARRILNLR